MANQRDIKRRIRSVTSTQQITKAMKMVAAAKLRRTQEAVIATRPFTSKLNEVLSRIVASAKDNLEHPLLEVRTVKKVGFVVVSADRGLSGGYNANIIKQALQSFNEHKDVEYGIVTIGNKANSFLKKRDYPIEEEFASVSDVPTLEEAINITNKVKDFYLNGVYDEVYMVYTKFITAMYHKPETVKLLPIEPPAGEELEEIEYIYEPTPQEVMGRLLPMFLQNKVFGMLMEAKASEHGATMTAMDSATNNASEMIDKLTLSLNRARQAAITTEISEIVAGANALS